ncbi:hypothetical protein F1542_03320, partial [Komagataeibacter sp. FXV3]|nr:hypothetical protein [Komagataeibacter sp. FXV3]
FVRPAATAFNANQDFLSHIYLPNDVNNDVVNDGKLPVTILSHKAASSGRLRPSGPGRLNCLTRRAVLGRSWPPGCMRRPSVSMQAAGRWPG